jgi:hypothetical protein
MTRSKARRPRARLRAIESRRLAGLVRALLMDLEAPRPPTRRTVASAIVDIGVLLQRSA